VREEDDPLRGEGGDLAPSNDPAPTGSLSIPPVTKNVEATERLEDAPAEPRSAPSASTPRLPSGRAVGRYELVELLGSGGMGSVYRAHDPHLSRDIALKVLHPESAHARSGSDYRHRLLREAQVLAKLSHPNVVAAFDVGTFEDVMFVAMELIAGESLRSWLRTRRSPGEVLRVLIAAGRGLVAAHAAGVLHRDFKPANVMVSPDGRVRVVDFGLARSAIASAEPEAAESRAAELRAAELGAAELGATELGARAPGSARSSLPHAADPSPSESGQRERSPLLIEGELTQTGMLMGTPGYIAPEQLVGKPADTLADQYSYAVTVFVALSRQKPPPCVLGASPTDSAPLEWPGDVPRRIRRIVERGLATRPSERHPSVAAMVDALERAIAPRRRSEAVLALALGTLLVVAGLLVFKARSSRVTCPVTPESFRQVWGPERRERLRQALASTGRANANEAFGLFAGRLDAFQKRWLAMKQESCEATHVRGEQSEQVLALRDACLDRRLTGAGALVTAFSAPDAAAVDRAASAVPETVEDCADTAALLGTAERLPRDAEARDRIVRIEARLPVVRALGIAGRWQEAGDGAREVLEEARATSHDPTIAQALRLAAFTTSSSARTVEERQQGEAYLREAIPLAARAGDDRLVARASSDLFSLLADGQDRIQEAEAMLPHVDALVIRAGDRPDDRLEVVFGQAQIMSQRRKYPEAIQLFERAIALSQTLENEFDADGATARCKIGEIYLELEKYPEAVESMRAGLLGLKSTFGTRHPRILIELANLARARSKVDTAAARATLLEMRELAANLPSEDWRAISIPFLEGQIREDSHDCPDALPFYGEALARFTEAYGAESGQTADVHQRLGACLQASGRRSQALAHLERALAIRRAKGTATHVLASTAFELARVLDRGARPSDRARAVELVREAHDLWRQDDVADKLGEAERWLAGHDRAPATPLGSRTVAH
jgi:serine/threonine protein kinase/tetratricopeptide (TPR) repeat protein